MSEVTFIIANRGGSNIDYVIKNFKDTFCDFFDGIKFIVITQGDTLSFKRGELYNIAMNYVDTEWVGLIDNDIINIDKFNPIAVYDNFGGPFIAFDKIAQVTLKEDGKYDITAIEDRTYGFGAFNFMRKYDFEQSGGFSNLCFGWGAEDNILSCKIRFKRYIHTLGHITHVRRVNDAPELTSFNREVYKKYVRGSINHQKDGYRQTTYTEIGKSVNGDTLELTVSNIGVVDSFEYMDLYNEVKNMENSRYNNTEGVKEGISICVSAYNTVKYIRECIDSIVNQTWFKKHTNWELLIGIDGCESTYACVKSFIGEYDISHIRVLMMDSNAGTYITTNTLMSEAKYDKMIRFDSDDVMPAMFIENFMVEGDADYVRFSFRTFGETRSYMGTAYGAVMLKKWVFLKYGGYMPWICAADYELHERLKKYVPVKLSSVGYLRRLHGTDSLQYAPETGMKSEIRKKYHDYVNSVSPIKPKIGCVVNTFTEYFPVKKEMKGVPFVTKQYDESVVKADVRQTPTVKVVTAGNKGRWFIADNKVISKSRAVKLAFEKYAALDIVPCVNRDYVHLYKNMPNYAKTSDYIVVVKSNVSFEWMDNSKIKEFIGKLTATMEDMNIGVYSPFIRTSSPFASAFKLGRRGLVDCDTVSDQMFVVRSSIVPSVVDFGTDNLGFGYIDYLCENAKKQGLRVVVDNDNEIRLYTTMENDAHPSVIESKNFFKKRNKV